jgi:predicted nucleotidyltransferase component of viral defense system
MSELLRESPTEFEALRDSASDRLGVPSGAIEKDYWATEVLRSTCAHDHGVDAVVFKGGTSLSKAYHLIERFSEDIDLLVVTEASGNALKRTLRAIAAAVTDDIGAPHEREREGRGYLNARFEYTTEQHAPSLSSGVLLEIGSRGGPTPNEVQPVRSLMAEAAAEIDPSALNEFADLTSFDVTVLAPERTLAEKLAFLHHRATVGDFDALRRGSRHLYDVAALLRSEDVRQALADGQMATLMIDVDERSRLAGWPFTARPEGGFGTSVAFNPSSEILDAFRRGFVDLDELVWGSLPDVERAIEEVRAQAAFL